MEAIALIVWLGFITIIAKSGENATTKVWMAGLLLITIANAVLFFL